MPFFPFSLLQEWPFLTVWTPAGLMGIPALIFAVRQYMRRPRLYKVHKDLEMWGGHPGEVRALIAEFFSSEGREYLDHGVVIKPGDTILDVGANYGFFTVTLLELFDNIHVHSFEPVPFTFANMDRNVKLWLSRHPTSKSTVQTNNVGMSSAVGKITFLEDYFASTSGHIEDNDGGLAAGFLKGLWNPPKILCASVERFRMINVIPELTSNIVCTLARVPVLGFFFSGAILAALGLFLVFNYLFVSRWVVCPLTTVSQYLSEHDEIKCIDLLKVDVEGAEELVLEGVKKPEHWAKIRQVAVEVHDIDGRMARLEKMLQSHGFTTEAVQEDSAWMKMFGVHKIFAVRK